MKNIGKFALVGVIVMTVLSFANFFGTRIAGAAVIVGVIFFFLHKRRERRSESNSGLDIRAIRRDLKQKGIWFWIILPVIMNALSIGIALIFLPDYLEHVVSRTEAFLSWNLLFLLIFQLAFFALGEEIAWRAFFQKQLGKMMPIFPALLLTSLLFSFGHIVFASPLVVVYDIFFVFINSVLYGIVFYRTDNAWVSAIAHFLANFSSVVFFLWIY
ncbi:CPBP family intramembrane glutamic endopeptidase [Salinicoccus luteus]|uniref:CPBP family intramembrane glutamic endopeptidase n=1 Tax=Salinicoccus luteus TaxID=367840 RepID=UPI0004E12D37|nr:CPBP family intramembrane glutamic endopeptidase [Salinicoccus luteus]